MYIDNSNRSDLFARLDEYRASPDRVQQVAVQGRWVSPSVWLVYKISISICKPENPAHI